MLLSALVERVRFEESLDESVFQYLLVHFFLVLWRGFKNSTLGKNGKGSVAVGVTGDR